MCRNSQKTHVGDDSVAVAIAQAENPCPECRSNENLLTGKRSHAASATTN